MSCVYCHDLDRSHAINDETKKKGPSDASSAESASWKAIAALREQEPSVEIETRWCPDPQERDRGWVGQGGRQRAG